jgi:hypothetical protein
VVSAPTTPIINETKNKWLLTSVKVTLSKDINHGPGQRGYSNLRFNVVSDTE